MQLSFEPGDLVINPERADWGTGQVQSVIGNRITVNFQNEGKLVINPDIVSLRYAEKSAG